jgi:transcriptional regulator with XRE-family HTH domain
MKTPDAGDLKIAENIRYYVNKRVGQKTRPTSINKIAESADLWPSSIVQWMQCERRPGENNLIALAAALKIPPAKLLVGVDDAYKRYPNIDTSSLRRQPLYSRIEDVMRTDAELARFFGGMSTNTLTAVRPELEKIVNFVQKRRENDIKGGKFDRKQPLY